MVATIDNIKTDLIDIIKGYVPDEVNLNNIALEKNLINDLKINSAHIVDIILDIEDKFDIMIDDETIGKMSTVENAIDIVSEKLQ